MYLVIGRVPVPTTHVQAWRLAAWAASGIVFGAHIVFEHLRHRRSVAVVAWHAAAAVAIGAIALAVAGMIHTLSSGAGVRPAWLLALVIWPAVTAVPAFLAALVTEAALVRLWPVGKL